jgi:hypothetical protein
MRIKKAMQNIAFLLTNIVSFYIPPPIGLSLDGVGVGVGAGAGAGEGAGDDATGAATFTTGFLAAGFFLATTFFFAAFLAFLAAFFTTFFLAAFFTAFLAFAFPFLAAFFAFFAMVQGGLNYFFGVTRFIDFQNPLKFN